MTPDLQWPREVAQVGNHVGEESLHRGDDGAEFRFAAVAEHFEAGRLAMDAYLSAKGEGFAVDLGWAVLETDDLYILCLECIHIAVAVDLSA